MSHSVSTRTYV